MYSLFRRLFVLTIIVVTLLALIQGVALASKSPSTRTIHEGSNDITGCASSQSMQNCDHHDPGDSNNGCTDAQTIDHEDLTNNGQVIGVLEVRWSENCQSVWTRVTNLNGDGITLYAYIERQMDSQIDTVEEGPLSNKYSIFTNMLFANSQTGNMFIALGSVNAMSFPQLSVTAPSN